MPRGARSALGGYIYHVLNRASARAAIFNEPGDYRAFGRVLIQAHERVPMRMLAYCLMPNHWHLVLWPHGDGDLSRFMRWLTVTHTQRWHAAHGTSGTGHLYQGRFKSFAVAGDGHLPVVCRYVERNALRSGLVRRAEDWRWGSLWRRMHIQEGARPLLAPWPAPMRDDWVEYVNHPQSEQELMALRQCVVRGRPFGGESWVKETAEALGVGASLRARGRPRRKGVRSRFRGDGTEP